MTISEFVKFWNKVNKTEMLTKYYLNNKQLPLFKLFTITEQLHSIKLTVTQAPFTNDQIIIYSDKYTELNQAQDQFFNTLRTHIPMGSFVYTLNIFLN